MLCRSRPGGGGGGVLGAPPPGARGGVFKENAGAGFAAEAGPGSQPFNRMMAPSAAAGLMASQTYRQFARACILHSARAALSAMRWHRGRKDHGAVLQ